jgi:hypothetical protein
VKTKAVTAMAGGIDNNQLKWQRRHGGSGDSNGNSSRGCSNSCRGCANNCRRHANAPGIGPDGITFATAVGAATTAACAATSAASVARSAWHFGRGVAHIAQYFPPLLEEVHAPHSQSEAEEEEAIIRGLWVKVATVVWVVLHAGCVCAVRPCCFVRLTCINAQKNQQTTAY